MIEYFKRKLAKLDNLDFTPKSFPIYYEQNGKLIKELENGEKFEVELTANFKEVIVRKCND